MDRPLWILTEGDLPLVAVALHHGHAVREELRDQLAVSEIDRFREEDPFTGGWTRLAPTQLVVLQSRFEVDMNRPPERAVYLGPEDAWGLKIWKEAPEGKLLRKSLVEHEAFYSELERLFTKFRKRFGRFVVFDLHSYNYRRGGPGGPSADPGANPDVNLGTGTLDLKHWKPVTERFMKDLRALNFLGRHLDVRENVKFKGGYFARWAHERFPDSACVLAIEVKKFFMDEWTGVPDPLCLEAVRKALESVVLGVLEELGKQA